MELVEEKTDIEKAQELLRKAKAEKEQIYIDKFNALLKEMNENGIEFKLKNEIVILAN